MFPCLWDLNPELYKLYLTLPHISTYHHMIFINSYKSHNFFPFMTQIFIQQENTIIHYILYNILYQNEYFIKQEFAIRSNNLPLRSNFIKLIFQLFMILFPHIFSSAHISSDIPLSRQPLSTLHLETFPNHHHQKLKF